MDSFQRLQLLSEQMELEPAEETREGDVYARLLRKVDPASVEVFLGTCAWGKFARVQAQTSRVVRLLATPGWIYTKNGGLVRM